MARFKELSTDERRTLPTIYASALVAALAEVKEMDEDAIVDEDGWVNCIKNNLRKLEIDLGNRDEQGSHTLFRAAQLLLSEPFDSYMTLAVQEKLSDWDED